MPTAPNSYSRASGRREIVAFGWSARYYQCSGSKAGRCRGERDLPSQMQQTRAVECGRRRSN